MLANGNDTGCNRMGYRACVYQLGRAAGMGWRETEIRSRGMKDKDRRDAGVMSENKDSSGNNSKNVA